MKSFAVASRNDREEAFLITARDINMSEAIVEKDFWVCWAGCVPNFV